MHIIYIIYNIIYIYICIYNIIYIYICISYAWYMVWVSMNRVVDAEYIE